MQDWVLQVPTDTLFGIMVVLGISIILVLLSGITVFSPYKDKLKNHARKKRG